MNTFALVVVLEVLLLGLLAEKICYILEFTLTVLGGPNNEKTL